MYFVKIWDSLHFLKLAFTTESLITNLSWNWSIQFLNILKPVFAIQKYKEAYQTSAMELFMKIVYDWRPLAGSLSRWSEVKFRCSVGRNKFRKVPLSRILNYLSGSFDLPAHCEYLLVSLLRLKKHHNCPWKSTVTQSNTSECQGNK